MLHFGYVADETLQRFISKHIEDFTKKAYSNQLNPKFTWGDWLALKTGMRDRIMELAKFWREGHETSSAILDTLTKEFDAMSISDPKLQPLLERIRQEEAVLASQASAKLQAHLRNITCSPILKRLIQ